MFEDHDEKLKIALNEYPVDDDFKEIVQKRNTFLKRMYNDDDPLNHQDKTDADRDNVLDEVGLNESVEEGMNEGDDADETNINAPVGNVEVGMNEGIDANESGNAEPVATDEGNSTPHSTPEYERRTRSTIKDKAATASPAKGGKNKPPIAPKKTAKGKAGEASPTKAGKTSKSK